jgi:hypothetical protein
MHSPWPGADPSAQEILACLEKHASRLLSALSTTCETQTQTGDIRPKRIREKTKHADDDEDEGKSSGGESKSDSDMREAERHSSEAQSGQRAALLAPSRRRTKRARLRSRNRWVDSWLQDEDANCTDAFADLEDFIVS